MHALVFTEPSPNADRTQIVELPDPEPGTGQVAIDVAAAGVNFVDVMARAGAGNYVHEWPHRPGHEVAGTVRAVGDGVEGLTVGQRVAAATPQGGGLAEIALADARLAVPIPADVDDATAATAPAVLATAVLLLTRVGRWAPGESILLHSASGGVGTAVAQLAATLGGGRRIGTVGSADKVDEARRRGWDVVLPRDEHLGDALRALAPQGFDLILDPLGSASLRDDLPLLAPLGRIVAFGNASGEPPQPLPPHVALMGANATVAGLSISALSLSAPGHLADAIATGLDLLAAGRIDMPPTELGSLHDTAGVHDLLAAGRGRGKYVVQVRPRAAAVGP